MARNITITFDDGSTHVYQNAPDTITPDIVQKRAEVQFGKTVTNIDGGNKQEEQQPNIASRIAAPFIRSSQTPFGVAEAGLGLATGLGASAYGGLKGIGSLVSGEGIKGANQAIEEAQRDYTYQPRLPSGRTAMEVTAMPIEYGSKAAGYVGGELGGLFGRQGEAAGQTIGEAGIPIALTLFGGVGALKGAKGIGVKDALRPLIPSNIPVVSDIARGVRDVYRTKSKGGTERLAEEYLKDLTTAEEAPKIVSALNRRNSEVVPGSPVTSGDAIARANREANLRGKPERFGSQYVSLEEGLSRVPETSGELTTVKLLQEKARADVLKKGVKTDAAYKAAEELRKTNATKNYGAIEDYLVQADAEVGTLMLRPSMEKAITRAESLAKEKGDLFQIGKNTPEQVIPSAILDSNGKPISTTTIKAQTAKYPVQSLQYIKMALDDMLKNPKDFGISGSELKSIASTRGEFISWIEKKAPLYKKANDAYAIDSLPLMQMDLWSAMRDKFIAPTGKESPGTYLRALRDETKLIKQATGFTRAGEITNIFNKEQSALATRLAAEMEMELVKKRMAGEVNLPGIGKSAEGLEPQLPNMLMRETMVANFLLRHLAKNANVDVNIAAAKILKDPKQLSGILKQIKPAHRPQVLNTIKDIAKSKSTAALTLSTAQGQQQ